MPDAPDSLRARTQALHEVVKDIVEQKTLRGWLEHMGDYLAFRWGSPETLSMTALDAARVGDHWHCYVALRKLGADAERFRVMRALIHDPKDTGDHWREKFTRVYNLTRGDNP